MSYCAEYMYLFQKVPLLCCLKSSYVWCFRVPFINMLNKLRQLSNIRHEFSYVIEFVHKGWNTIMTRDLNTKQ